MMDLSVTIVNWNAEDLLIQCLEFIHQMMPEIRKEVFVVDNGSTNEMSTMVKERFPDIHLIQNQRNVGFAKANNQTFRLSKGKYLLLLNPDTKVKEGAIERLISFMETHSDAGVAGGQLLNGDGSKQNSIANFPSLATELLNKSLLRRLFPKKFPGKERNYSEPVEVDSVIGACMMVRRAAMEQVGLLDEDYFLFLEETDWCYRMKRAGWKVYHVPQVEVYHFQGKSVGKARKRARVEFYRSRYHFFKRNRGPFQWFVLLMGMTIRLGVELMAITLGSLVTLFRIKGWREKLSIYAYLLWWHLRLCPKGMGLRE